MNPVDIAIAMSMFGIGGTLFVISAMAFNRMTSCSSAQIRNSWVILMVLGACVLTASLGLLMCQTGPCSNDQNTRTIVSFIGILGCLSVATLVLSSIMYSNYKKVSDCESNPSSRWNQEASKIIMISSAVLSGVCMFSVLVILGRRSGAQAGQAKTGAGPAQAGAGQAQTDDW